MIWCNDFIESQLPIRTNCSEIFHFKRYFWEVMFYIKVKELKKQKIWRAKE